MTYSELADAIQQWTENDEASFVSAIPSIVRKAESRIALAIRVPNSKKTATGNLSTGVSTLDVPTDLIYAKEFRVTLPTVGERYLRLKDLSYLREAFPLLVNGSPEVYALSDDDTYQIAPPPASTYAYTLEYMANPSSIVDEQSSWMGTNAHSLLLDACLLEAAIFMKQPEEQIMAMKARLDEALNDLRVIREGKTAKDTYRKPDLRIET